MPTEDVDGGRDTQCVNIVHGPQVDTYLTQDVRTAAVHAFRVRADAAAWGLMGYSSGGFCATNLAMRHPDMFSAGVSIAGYSRPAHDHQTGDLFHGDTAARDANTPLWRASHLPLPEIALLLISSNEDPETAHDAMALAALAGAPMSVTRIDLTHGGHNFEVWRAEEPEAFAWLSSHLVAPLAPAPVIDHLNPTVSGAAH
jgi:S-formylglutathione hydrolase FrmB